LSSLPYDRVKAKPCFAIRRLQQVDRAGFGPAKDRPLADAGNCGRFIDGYEIALFAAPSTPAFNRFFGSTDHQQALGFNRDACSSFLHRCQIDLPFND